MSPQPCKSGARGTSQKAFCGALRDTPAGWRRVSGWPRGLKGDGWWTAAGRPGRLLSSDRMRAAYAGQPGEHAWMHGAEDRA